MEINILGYAIIFLVFIISYRIYLESDYLHLKCIISDVDGKRYYGNVYYDSGVKYAGVENTGGQSVRVYDTRRDSIPQ